MKRNAKQPNLVSVYAAQGHLRAAVIKSALESAGIPVMLKFESIGPTLGLTVDGIGRVHILVPAEWEQEARDLLATDHIEEQPE